MGYKTKRKKIKGTNITNSTTQHSDGRIRHTRTAKTGNSTISTSRNPNGSLRVTKTQRSNGYTYRSQKTYGSPTRSRTRKKSGDMNIGLFGFLTIVFILVLMWMSKTFPIFTEYFLWFMFGVIVIGVVAWIVWTLYILRYFIFYAGVIFSLFYLWSKYL